MKFGFLILYLLPVAFGLVAINCMSWTLVRLRTGGLPVQMGVGWPWCFYTYAVNRVGPSEWHLQPLLLDAGVGIGIILAVAGLVFVFTKEKKKQPWR